MQRSQGSQGHPVGWDESVALGATVGVSEDDPVLVVLAVTRGAEEDAEARLLGALAAFAEREAEGVAVPRGSDVEQVAHACRGFAVALPPDGHERAPRGALGVGLI